MEFIIPEKSNWILSKTWKNLSNMNRILNPRRLLSLTHFQCPLPLRKFTFILEKAYRKYQNVKLFKRHKRKVISKYLDRNHIILSTESVDKMRGFLIQNALRWIVILRHKDPHFWEFYRILTQCQNFELNAVELCESISKTLRFSKIRPVVS